jgi:hypothetical protein
MICLCIWIEEETEEIIMIDSLLSLLSGGTGGILAGLATGVLKIFTAKQEAEHEFRMTELQLKIDQARADQQIDLVHAQGEMENAGKELDAYMTALQGQAQLSGVSWIDGLNKSVRPFITYWWMILFTIYKICTIIVTWPASWDKSEILAFAAGIWTVQDWAIFGTILGFWFVNRTLMHQLK